MTLTDFLLARIDEDAAGVTSWIWIPDHAGGGEHTQGATVPPTPRALAECDAKRRIVALLTAMGTEDESFGPEADAERAALTDVLRLLALPYANHADYRAEWRP